MSEFVFSILVLICCALIFVGGGFHDQGVISYDCDNYGKSRIDGTWYECREIKSPLVNGKQEG